MNTVEHSMARTRARLEALRTPLDAGDTRGAEAATEELAATIEELDVALEELQQQNAELVASRSLLAAERERFADLFHHAPEPYLITTPEGVVEEGNAAAAALLCVPQDRLTGRVLALFVPMAERPAFREQLRSLSEPTTSLDLTLVPRDRPSIVVSAMVTVSRAPPDAVELRWALRDVTDARRAQSTLQSAFTRSREETEELRELDRWKNAFLAAAAHDLRAPLAVITTASETLLARDDLRADQGRLVEMIGAHAQRLRQLLDDLLDLDRFTRGTITAERAPTDLRELVTDAVDQLRPVTHTVDVAVPHVVADVDPARTAQIVTNLLRNAIVHTSPGTSVHVRVEAQDDGVDLIVEDDGPGIPPRLRHQVFQPFVTRPAHLDDTPGTGLGLSLVQLFAELHGGSVHVDDSVSGGARFTVHLPAHVRT